MDISPHHPGAAQDLTFHDKPRSNSIGYTLESDVSALICGDGGLFMSTACDCGADQQTANHIITEYPLYHSPSKLLEI